jgi:hypothetical protein
MYRQDGKNALSTCTTTKSSRFTTVLKFKERFPDMDLKTVVSGISRVGSRRLLVAKKHSPTAMFVVGVVGVVATTVLACQATLKLDEIVENAEAKVKEIKECASDEYTETDRNKDTAIVVAKTVGRIVALYSPALIVGALSISALTGSHVVLSRRNVALTAAYAGLDKGFREYRQRVADELGSNKEREFRYAAEDHVIIEDTEEGPVTKRIKRPGEESASIYARFFDEHSPQWSREWAYNPLFIQCQQNYMNDLLRSRGHVFLNEVYDALGLPRSKAGQMVGWLNDGDGDGYIDFGVFEGDSHSAMRFVNGQERSILLDFNVDGIIYDKI